MNPRPRDTGAMLNQLSYEATDVGSRSAASYMTIGSRQKLANAKFMNLELDNRPIEHKPSTKLRGVHIDEMLTWDNQMKHISSSL